METTVLEQQEKNLSADFLKETLQARREWLAIFKVMKINSLQPRSLPSKAII